MKVHAGAIATHGRSRPMLQHLEQVAEEIAHATEREAPTDMGIDAGPGHVDTKGGVAQVHASHAGAVAIEFGSVNNAPYSPFRRAVRALGLRLTDRGRH